MVRSLKLSWNKIDNNEEANYISIDSSGIQTYTGNEWLENRYGKRYNRRTWKKIHMVVNDKGLIAANSTTEHNVDDRSQVDELLSDINTKKFLADPGYNREDMYQLLRSKRYKANYQAAKSSSRN